MIRLEWFGHVNKMKKKEWENPGLKDKIPN